MIIFPRLHAKDNRVSPYLFVLSISAPCSIKYFAISTYPLLVEINKGVSSYLFV